MVNPLVLIGLGLYLALMLGIGLYASRRVKGSVDYIVAGKRLPLLLCTATLAATWFGGGICIGAASAAYEGGFLAVVADPFGAALCLFLAGLFYVRMMRRMGMVIGVKPEMIKTYKRLHSAVWPDVLAQIFEPFFTTKGSEGSGLGLDISRQIVAAHGGVLRCDSEVGRGTTMILEFPALED